MSVPGAGSAGSSTRPTTGLVSNSAVCRTDSLSAVTRGYIVHTFGCQMNEHDSERIAGLLEDDGYVAVSDQADADVVVLNTCCIRENADNKLYGTLGWLKPWKEASDGRQIVVAGCLAQKDRDLVRRKAPFVDVVLGTHNVHRAAELVGEARVSGPITEILDEAVLDDQAMLVPGPAQAAATVALGDDDHVQVQRDRYRRRLEHLGKVLSLWSGVDVPFPAGGFYLWFDAGDGWEFAERLAREGGALVSPGDFYGAGGAQNVRAAVVQPDHRIELVARRLGVL